MNGLDAGSLQHRQCAAEGKLQRCAARSPQPAARYRGTGLAAFRNVADTLKAIEADARTLAAVGAAEPKGAAARPARSLAR